MKIEKLVAPLKNYLWGGTKLKNEYGKTTELDTVAESWELSFHKDGKTMLENGNFLSDVVSKTDLGSNCDAFEFFPTLTKFIDAKDNLSIQVHPSDDYAIANENSYGKTEMWYVVEAEENAGIYLGLNKSVTTTEFETAIANNTLTSILNYIPVKKGDCYFIPSGTIHAIGSGCLIYEIQQNSNLTYRVFDYNRKDANGNTRELHVDKAKKVTNLNKFTPKQLVASTSKGEVLGISKYFTATKLVVSNPMKLTTFNSFCCVTCMGGHVDIENISLTKGESAFIPASYGKYEISGNATLILTEVRKYSLVISSFDIKIVDDEKNVIYQVQCTKPNNETISNALLNVNMTINDIENIIRI
jgi:mannose-6-phosphate isomerase